MVAAYRAKGAFTSGTGNITPPLPSGLVDGDLMILVVHSVNEAISAPTSPQTWTAIPAHSGTAERGSAGLAGGVRVRVFYRWWVSGDGAPTVTDTGDMTAGQIYRFSGVDPTTPFDGVTPVGFNAAAATTHTLTGVTTGTNLAYVVHALALDRDAASTANIGFATNGNLHSMQELHDETVATNQGGGICVIGGCKETAGASGSTATDTGASTAIAGITFSLRSKVLPSRIISRASTYEEGLAGEIAVTLSGVTAGNSIMVVFSSGNIASVDSGIPTISDDRSNSYTAVLQQQAMDETNGDSAETFMWAAQRANASGNVTITAAKNADCKAFLTAFEVSGLPTGTQIWTDNSTSNNASHSSLSPTAVTPPAYMASYLAFMISSRFSAGTRGCLDNSYATISENVIFAGTVIGVQELSGGADVTGTVTYTGAASQGLATLLVYQIGGGFRGTIRNINNFQHMMVR